MQFLKRSGLSCFNINNVIDISYIFNNCSSLKKLKTFSFDSKNKINTSYMFNGCYSLKNYYNFIWKFNVKNIVITSIYIFFAILCLLSIIIYFYGKIYN